MGVIQTRTFIKLLFPIKVPIDCWRENAQMSDLVGVVMEPSGASLFEPRVEDMTMTGLDEARADG